MSSAPVSFQRLLQLTMQPTENKPKSFSESTDHSSPNESAEGSGSTTSGIESEPQLMESISTFLPPIHDPVHNADISTNDWGPLLSTLNICPAYQNLTYVGALAISFQEEAEIRLAAAHACRKVTHAKRHLALCTAQEHDILGQLYHF